MRESKASEIRHPGVVERIEGNTVIVRIESQAACGQCQAKSHCGMVESADKLIEIKHIKPDHFATGQKVIVKLKQSLGYKALMLGYITPFLILIISLFAIALITGNEGLAAFIAVLLMAPYYALLYKYRNKLRKTFHFTIDSNAGAHD